MTALVLISVYVIQPLPYNRFTYIELHAHTNLHQTLPPPKKTKKQTNMHVALTILRCFE